MRVKKLDTRGELDLWQDVETERTFWRILGGIAWPGEGPGCVVVVGEEAKVRPDPPYHLHVLAEAEERNPAMLIRKGLELASMFCVRDFYGYTGNVADMEFLQHYNRTARQRREPVLNVLKAPTTDTDGIHFHVNILLSRLSASDKTLHFPPGSSLPGRLLEIQGHELTKAKAGTYPAVAALGYVVAELSVYEFEIPRSQLREEYEPFKHM